MFPTKCFIYYLSILYVCFHPNQSPHPQNKKKLTIPKAQKKTKTPHQTPSYLSTPTLHRKLGNSSLSTVSTAASHSQPTESTFAKCFTSEPRRWAFTWARQSSVVGSSVGGSCIKASNYIGYQVWMVVRCDLRRDLSCCCSVL